MANGIMARQVDAVALKNPTSAASLPVYLGQAPIWQIDSPDWKELAGKTVLAKTLADVRASLGFALPDGMAWNKAYSLSMCAYYHMANEQISPIVLINNANVPALGEDVTVALTFVNGRAEIVAQDVVISTLALEDKVKGVDFTAVYDESGKKVIINDLTGELENANASYTPVKLDSIVFSAKTFDEIQYIPQNIGAKPAFIAAPLWDDEEDTAGAKVRNGVTNAVEDTIDKHWFAQAFVQLSGDTREDAIIAKEMVTSPKVKACWPYIQYGTYVYPLSLVFSAKRQSVDNRNMGIPYESASNEYVAITKLCTADGKLVKQLENEADELNAVGIATMAFTTAMQWRTWGVCMANYSEKNKENIPPNKLNDVAVQMMDYISNDFEERFGNIVHKPMSMRVVNDIILTYTQVLRVLISAGQLIDGSITFEASENSTAQLADGEFVYSISQTNTPPAKAIIAKVSYDSNALENYFGGLMGGEE